MLRVAALGKIICEKLPTGSVQSSLVVKALFLHDMGNILKFDLSDTSLLAEEDKERVDDLLRVQHEFREQFGTTPDEATIAIIPTICSDPSVLKLYKDSQGSLVHQFVEEPIIEKKICYYGDMKIGPFGILPLEQRFADMNVRYPHYREQHTTYLVHAQNIEQQLITATGYDIRNVDDMMLNKQFAVLLEMEF